MTDTIDKIIAEYTVLKLQVEQSDEKLARTENYYRDKIRKQEAYYENLRPHWAKGYSSDSVAAQSHLSATLHLWDLLGVDNQTEAVAKIQKLLEASF